MDYLVDERKFYMSYRGLAEAHHQLCMLSDDDFMKALPEAIHLACVICYFKEIPTSVCLSDLGIVHQLAHLLHIKDEPLIDLAEIRQLFCEQLKLT